MDKIIFQDGTKVSNAKVTINNVDYPVTPAVYSGTTPFTAANLNLMQDNIETAINQKKSDIIVCKPTSRFSLTTEFIRDIPKWTEVQNTGNSFSLIEDPNDSSKNYITIGAGVTKIRIFLELNTAVTSQQALCSFSIMRHVASTSTNSTAKSVNNNAYYNPYYGSGESIYPGFNFVTSEIIDVSEGDDIRVRAWKAYSSSETANIETTSRIFLEKIE